MCYHERTQKSLPEARSISKQIEFELTCLAAQARSPLTPTQIKEFRRKRWAELRDEESEKINRLSYDLYCLKDEAGTLKARIFEVQSSVNSMRAALVAVVVAGLFGFAVVLL